MAATGSGSSSPGTRREKGKKGKDKGPPAVEKLGITRATLPLELTFRGMRSVAEIPRCVLKDQIEAGLVEKPEETAEELAAKAAAGVTMTQTAEEKEDELLARLEPIPADYEAVRLENNAIDSLDGLLPALRAVITDPAKVCWLDLSFNHISTIEGKLDGLPNLKSVYLHANDIDSLRSVQYLASIAPNLMALTLHHTPLREMPDFRLVILSLLPNLRKLDFVPVTKRERDQAERFRSAHRGRFSMRKVAAPAASSIPSPPGSQPRATTLPSPTKH